MDNKGLVEYTHTGEQLRVFHRLSHSCKALSKKRDPEEPVIVGVIDQVLQVAIWVVDRVVARHLGSGCHQQLRCWSHTHVKKCRGNKRRLWTWRHGKKLREKRSNACM
eukprot:2799721-Amphidinium_carterae.1